MMRDREDFTSVGGNSEVWCNGRSEQSKDALSVCAQSFKHGCLPVVEQSRCRTHRPQTTTIAMDAKPYKHTQILTLQAVGKAVQNAHSLKNYSDSAKLSLATG